MDILNYWGQLIDKLKLDKKKLLIVIVSCLVLVFMDIAFLLGPQLKSLNKSTEKIVKLSKDIKTGKADLAKAEDMASGPSLKSTKVKSIVLEEQLPALLQDIYTAAKRNKINIAQINTSKEVRKEAAEVKQKATKPGTKNKPKAAKEQKPVASRSQPVLITVDWVAEYHNLGMFINDLENLTQFLSVDQLTIYANPDNYLFQKGNLILKTYVNK